MENPENPLPEDTTLPLDINTEETAPAIDTHEPETTSVASGETMETPVSAPATPTPAPETMTPTPALEPSPAEPVVAEPVKRTRKGLWAGLVVLVVAIFVLGLYLFDSRGDVTQIMSYFSGKTVTKDTAPMVSQEVQKIHTTIPEQPGYDFSAVPEYDVTGLKLGTGFPAYQAPKVTVAAKVPVYKVAPGLSNVKNLEYFKTKIALSDEESKKLVTNAFVVSDDYSDSEFFSLYEKNRYDTIPSFITTDSILHNYHILFDSILKQLEESKLAFALHTLNARLVSDAEKQLKDVGDGPWQNAATRNLAFFTVGSKLLDPAVKVSPEVAADVASELALIEGKKGIDYSVIMNRGIPEEKFDLEALKEDYTQYIPRGHYTQSLLLTNYFKSMMWYGRLSFRFKNENEIRSAVLITLALRETKNNLLLETLSDPIDFLVGKGDDIGFREMNGLLEEVYGDDVTLTSVLSAPEKFSELVEKTKKLAPPEINSIPVFNASIAPDREAEIKAFRFMGQRFTIDAAIFQRLIDREVSKRMLPNGLDIPAALGSKEALSLLSNMGETKYENYTANMTKLSKYLAGLSENTWTQNVYWGWIHTLRTLTQPAGKGYPLFMQNTAWTRKELNTFLGSWSQLKHDTILYAKQVMAELGGGGDDEIVPPDDRGYVEPNPELYARLGALLTMTKDGLDAKKLLTDGMRDSLSRMETLTKSLQTISEKELKNITLTTEEYELIRSYGGQIEHFWIEANKDMPEYKEMGQWNFLNQNPAAIIADVATDPNGEVLEVGTGEVQSIYVIVPVDGMLKVTRGGVYSYYEFRWPMDDRLTDKKWRAMMGFTYEADIPRLEEDAQPKQPSWTDIFMGK